ncbi:MAG TPA: hypothetical protein VK728_13375 [Candidatus Sulfotelmatobacter sp.]|jgi:hypothetical protein|nr:hypothetical protein [Candidatus Sulfotelmatobacter sp.]
MISIDSRAATKLQPELFNGERIYWAAMPNPRIIFHSDDWSAIPFSLIWTGFFVFWEGQALGFWRDNPRPHAPSTFEILWGIPFLLIGQYMVWGRFFGDAWLKRRTYYAVTNRRVLILQEGWKRKFQFSFLESIPEISREGDDTGTLWLGTKLPLLGGRRSAKRNMSRFYMGDGVPTLADIENVDSVYHLILDLREQARKQSQPQS